MLFTTQIWKPKIFSWLSRYHENQIIGFPFTRFRTISIHFKSYQKWIFEEYEEQWRSDAILWNYDFFSSSSLWNLYSLSVINLYLLEEVKWLARSKSKVPTSTLLKIRFCENARQWNFFMPLMFGSMHLLCMQPRFFVQWRPSPSTR